MANYTNLQLLKVNISQLLVNVCDNLIIKLFFCKLEVKCNEVVKDR